MRDTVLDHGTMASYLKNSQTVAVALMLAENTNYGVIWCHYEKHEFVKKILFC